MYTRNATFHTALVAGLVMMCLALPRTAAADMIPIPPQKPQFEEVSTEASAAPVAFADAVLSLLNFSQDILETERPVPPTPKTKPVVDTSKPLSSDDADTYKRIFAYQAAGDMHQADREMARLKDFRLRGAVLYQRFMHPTAYTSSYEELSNWLALYNDTAGADKIYKMAARKGSEAGLKKPVTANGHLKQRGPAVYQGRSYQSPQARTAAQQATIKEMYAGLRTALNNNDQAAALALMDEDAFGMLDSVEQDLIHARIAASFMYSGNLDRSFDIAAQSAKRSGLHVPQAGWTAGLIAWRRGHYKDAARYFEIPARSPYASGWTSAAGAYWAARSYMKAGNVRMVSAWLKRAASHPRTFYGLIATRALGRDFAFNWDVPKFTKQHFETLAATKAGQRAIALVAAGQIPMAEAELLRLGAGDDKALRESLLSYAAFAGMPGLAMRLGNAMGNEEGDFYDAALYPTGPWKPKEGYKIDPALIHAIMRQESRFDPDAQSRSGARGLMQLMPTTAKYVAGKKAQQGLSDPEMNLEIGQSYLETLLAKPYVDGDLFMLLVAYNAGPGNLLNWKKQMPEVKDPLLFIESIPLMETRAYVEKVLANYWIYRLREDLPTPTLDAVAAGQNAVYAMLDKNGLFELASQ